SGRVSLAANPLVSQHVVVGGGEPAAAPDRHGADRGGSRPRVAGNALARVRGSPAPPVHRERDELPASLRSREPHALRQGRHQRLRGREAGRRGEPGARGNQGGSPLPSSPGSWRDGGGEAASRQRTAPRRRPGRGVRRASSPPTPGSRRVLPPRDSVP